MDVSEFWPFLPPLTAVVVGVALRRLVRRWPFRLMSLGLIVHSLVQLLELFWVATEMRVRTPPQPSPDGAFIAIRSFGLQGALGADGATIRIRRRGKIHAETVFRAAAVAPISPTIRWPAPSKVEVRYSDDRIYEHRCGQRVDGVEIVCVKVPPTSS